jgi:hypothetical protein
VKGLRRVGPCPQTPFVGVALLFALAGFAAAEPLRALRWLAPGSDRVAALTRQPGECLAATGPAIEIGRAAFRSPLLLGGQAARAGLACDSCHRNGRGNPDFRFPGVSGAAGTADVTSSLFSRMRGDGIDNPKPIPDLANDRKTIGAAQLRSFIQGLVVEEFDGAVPPPAVLDGLVAYVEALRPAACAPAGSVTAAGVAGAARRAVSAARGALARGDAETSAVMVMAARGQLGLLHERFAGMAAEQKRLRGLDADLATALGAVREGDAEASAQLARWEAQAPRWTAALSTAEPRSLFNPEQLRKKLGSGA